MRYRTIVIVAAPGLDPGNVVIEPVTWRNPEGNKGQVELSISDLPADVRSEIEKGVFPVYLLCHANLGADKVEGLDLADFELAPEPDPNDGLA